MRRDVLLTWLLLPGAMLHELTHIIVAVRFGGYRVKYWRAVPSLPIVGTRITFVWNERTPLWGILAAQIAPLLIGVWLSPIVAYGALVALSAGVPLAVVGWIALNWLLYVALSSADIGGARRAYREWPLATESPS